MPVEQLTKIILEKAKGTLVIPLWSSAPFWPKIHGRKKFKPFVKDFKEFRSDVVERGRGNNGIFGKKGSDFRMVALRIIP